MKTKEIAVGWITKIMIYFIIIASLFYLTCGTALSLAHFHEMNYNCGGAGMHGYGGMYGKHMMGKNRMWSHHSMKGYMHNCNCDDCNDSDHGCSMHGDGSGNDCGGMMHPDTAHIHSQKK